MQTYHPRGGSPLRRLRDRFRETRLFDSYKRFSAVGEFLFWKLRGSPGPKVPHFVKQQAVRQYARRFGLKVLVETGTNFGQMIHATRDMFHTIYSIELDDWRYELARKKFASSPQIHLLHGDSGQVLPQLIQTVSEPCLFWLDGHDGDVSAPIRIELEAVLQHPVGDHVLLIDDARWFDGRGDYPTLEELRQRVMARYPSGTLELRDDIIRIYGQRK